MALIAASRFFTVAPPGVRNLISIFGGDISAVSKMVGISPSRIEKYLTGKIKPSVPVLSRFQQQYEVTSYNMLRSFGASWRDAMSFSSKSPKAILERIRYLDDMSKALSKYYNVDIAGIRKGMSNSENASDNWDESNDVLKAYKAGLIK